MIVVEQLVKAQDLLASIERESSSSNIRSKSNALRAHIRGMAQAQAEFERRARKRIDGLMSHQKVRSFDSARIALLVPHNASVRSITCTPPALRLRDPSMLHAGRGSASRKLRRARSAAAAAIDRRAKRCVRARRRRSAGGGMRGGRGGRFGFSPSPFPTP